MLDAQQFHSSDRWENRAIDQLTPHLDRAISIGAPVVVPAFPTALSQSELVAVAVRLCKGNGGAAVLVGPAIGCLTFVPFATPGRAVRRPAPEPLYSRRRDKLSVAPLAELTI